MTDEVSVRTDDGIGSVRLCGASLPCHRAICWCSAAGTGLPGPRTVVRQQDQAVSPYRTIAVRSAIPRDGRFVAMWKFLRGRGYGAVLSAFVSGLAALRLVR